MNSKALVQECSKRNVFLKILPNSLEKNCAGVSFMIKVHPQGIKSHFHVHIIPGTGNFQ